jgi:multisubunit Na+/H+ antiporter MnhE subunit
MGYNLGMNDLLIGAAFAAFVVWLTMRIVSRREMWAKWTAALLVAMLLLLV